MNIGHATEYRNTSQLFIGVNLLNIVEGLSNGGADGSDGSGIWEGAWAWGLAPEKNFVLRNVELLCILDYGVGRLNSKCQQQLL